MACVKRGYPGPNAARRQSQHMSCRLRPYFCDECRSWHITNAEKEGSRRNARWRPSENRRTR